MEQPTTEAFYIQDIEDIQTHLSLDFSKLSLRQRVALFLLPFYILFGKSFKRRVS